MLNPVKTDPKNRVNIAAGLTRSAAQSYPPPMQIKLFAKCVGISRTAVYNAFERGKLDRIGNEGVDLLGERTAAYLVGYGLTGPEVTEIAEGKRPVPAPRKPRLVTPAARKRSPAGKTLPPAGKKPVAPPSDPWKPPVPPGGAPPPDLTKISDEQLFSQGADVLQRVLAAEKIIDTRQTRAAKRGELIKRSTVTRFTNIIVSIHRSELASMGARVSPEVLSACGITEDAMLVKIEEVIDAAAYRVIAHIQRQALDFLKEIKAEEDE